MESMNNIGIALKEIRKSKGFSAQKLASEIGVGVATIYRIENDYDYSVSLNMLIKICKILDCSVVELFEKAGIDTKINSKTLLKISQITGKPPAWFFEDVPEVGSNEVINAIRADFRLTNRQKEQLIGLYELFVEGAK